MIDCSQSDRPNGRDYEITSGIEYENDAESVWHIKGSVETHPWGQEETIEYRGQQMPPTMPPEEMLKQQEIKVANGERSGDMHRAVVEIKTTMASGRVTSSKDSMMLFVDPPGAHYNEEEAREALVRVLDSSKRMDKVFLDREL